MNEMDENKLPLDNFKKLVAQKLNFQREPCSWGSKSLSCPKEQSCSIRKKRLKLFPKEHPCS
jgi:hypothetical protein